jgi:hypothetical protein
MSHRQGTCAAALAIAVTVACGSEPQASPEAAVHAFVAAADRQDLAAMRALAVPPERLRRTVTCAVVPSV